MGGGVEYKYKETSPQGLSITKSHGFLGTCHLFTLFTVSNFLRIRKAIIHSCLLEPERKPPFIQPFPFYKAPYAP